MNRLILMGLLMVSLVAADCGTSTVVDGKTYQWYLSDLTAKTDFQALDSNAQAAAVGQLYYWNFCTAVTAVTSADCTGAAVCQKAVNGYKSCGTLSSMTVKTLAVTTWPNGETVSALDGVTVTYSGGAQYASGVARKTDIHVRCDRAALTPTIVNNDVVEAPGLGYTIYMNSVVGCPSDPNKSGGGSGDAGGFWFDGGSIIIIVVLVLVVLYLGVGAGIQYKFRGARTPKELILFGEYIFMLPSLVKDGALFILHGFKKGDYVTV